MEFVIITTPEKYKNLFASSNNHKELLLIMKAYENIQYFY